MNHIITPAFQPTITKFWHTVVLGNCKLLLVSVILMYMVLTGQISSLHAGAAVTPGPKVRNVQGATCPFTTTDMWKGPKADFITEDPVLSV